MALGKRYLKQVLKYGKLSLIWQNIWGILGDYLKQSWQNIVEGFNAIFGPLAGIAGSIWNSIVNVVKTVVSGLGAFYQVYGQLL